MVSAYTLYRDPEERDLHDVDVRILPRDYDRIEAMARAHGWRTRETKRAYRNYVFDVDGIDVDVECSVGPPHVCGLTIEQMLERATRSSVLGFETLVPDFTDHVVLQIVNIFKDKIVLARPAALHDLERIAAHRAFDVSALAARLRESGAATIGRIVSRYAVSTIASSRWSELLHELGPPRRPWYEAAVRRASTQPEAVPAIVLARVASDDPFERARALVAMARWGVERMA